MSCGVSADAAAGFLWCGPQTERATGAAPGTVALLREARYLCLMTVHEQVRLLRREILHAAEAYGARRVRLFGSAARGQETGASDVDLLVALEPGRTLLDLARLEARLEQLLDRAVDVVPESGLKEPFRSTVLRDAVDV